ncbi:UDP-N-acetylmuramate:L-alanyl-gamma-D-glutamyl-meso-diaminopimelate ligase [Alkalilimnicola ehrlichii]|uniref:UDP-N-acetylmuramate:L-alanyl-gamma-D-glutamyl- meso-diaminopimelate ligase n=1 Tax=Alkalilimnicola ehrlichii TaxID=351052 RepID=UPI003BA17406
MHLHILGICGTFMGGLALLAREAGHVVSGSDQGIYPPMSDMLAEQAVDLRAGYAPSHLQPPPDQVIVGNALSRGNPAVEYVLDQGLRYTSGPQWLGEHLLHDRWVLAVCGTHGKTTTASLLAWILEYAGLNPGFLVGGVPTNFGRSARLGDGPFFVIEADEYDSAFFDKRSKFIHFRPRTLVIHNIEYDHADIFPDLAAIQRQFHHLVRTVPGNGLIIANGDQANVAETLDQGCWTPTLRLGTGPDCDWRYDLNGQGEMVLRGGDATPLTARPPLPGLHNAANCAAALLAARHVGVPLSTGLDALAGFRGVKRRLELRGEAGGVRVYDDFAHHPTAIRATLEAMRPGPGRLLAVLEPRSNTMRMGIHRERLAAALAPADAVFALQGKGLEWSVADALAGLTPPAEVAQDVPALVQRIRQQARPGDRVVVMSNGAFDGLHGRLLAALDGREVSA